MDIHYEPIPNGSYRLWAVQKGADRYSPYTIRINLENLGDGVCEAAGGIGGLDRETIINIGKVAIGLGWHTLKSSALHGVKVSDLLTYTHSDDRRNYYTCDLLEVAERLEIEGMK